MGGLLWTGLLWTGLCVDCGLGCRGVSIASCVFPLEYGRSLLLVVLAGLLLAAGC